MTSRPVARLAAAGLAAAVSLAGLTGATASTASTTSLADQLADKALDIPVVAPDGFARAIVAFEDGLPTGVLDDLTDLGVVRGIELTSIDAVAVTALPSVLADVAHLAGVTALEPQRRIDLDLYASKGDIDALDLDTPGSFTRDGVTVEHDGLTGEGVGVAILDSGMAAAHPDLVNTADGFHFSFSEIQDEGGISFEQWDPYVEATGPIALQDEIGHGTHVASTVGGTGEMSAMQDGPDLRGVAPGVTFYSMKITTAPFGIVEDLDFEEAALAAFDYSIRHKDDLGIDITQNSWGLLPAEPDCLGAGCGEPTDFDGMARMVEAVGDAGIVVVFSAGNSGDAEDGSSTIGIFNDAGTAIAVAAACKSVDSGCSSDEEAETGITDFSSRGNDDGTGAQVDVAAPGDQIMAALSPSVLAPLTECAEAQTPGYYCISGTSMASPHVSGVVALMLEQNPDLTPGQVEDCVTATADDMGAAGYDQHSGFGMINTRSAIACAAAGPVTDAAPRGPVIERLSGEDRYETAAVAALDAYAPADVDTVYLAVGTNYPDALAGGPLAGAQGAPILLTTTDELPQATADALATLDPDVVIAFGGPLAISDATLEAAGAAGSATTERIAGADRYETAAEIARAMPASLTAHLVVGTDFPDALAGGPATDGGPILLTRSTELPQATADALGALDVDRVVAIGGPGAISDAVLTAAGDAADAATSRLEGPDRYATAIAVADTMGAVDTVYVSVGTNYPDALAGSSVAIANGAPIVLTAKDDLPTVVADYLGGQDLDRIVVLGGPQAVDQDVMAQIDAAAR